MPNMIAYGALIAWPLVALVLFLTMPAGRAAIITTLWAYLLLPVSTEFNFPMVPALDKTSIPSLTTFVLALAFAGRGEWRWPRNPLITLLMLIFVFSPILTGFANREPIIIGMGAMRGLSFYDSISACSGQALLLLPFLVGFCMLGNERHHRDLLTYLVMAALIYSLPILLEIRLSPFLQTRIYHVIDVGYFLQQMRDGGFRSMVFLGHGLLVSAFLSLAIIAAVGRWRMRAKLWGLPPVAIVAYLVVVLILNKSLGALLLVLVVAPLLYFLRPRRMITVGLALSSLLLLYPAARSVHALPLQAFSNAIASIDQNRAGSFEFRLTNEEELLGRAMQKPTLGWGGFGRNRLHEVIGDSYKSVSTTDGFWIIIIGTWGWLGYIATFGLLCYPFWRAFRLRKIGVSLASVTLLAVLLANLLDLIPNNSLRPFSWLIAGALASMTAPRSRAPSRPTQVPDDDDGAGREPVAA